CGGGHAGGGIQEGGGRPPPARRGRLAGRAPAAKLKGKKALVFGGTSGIGLAAARQLSELGAAVVAIGRDPSKAGVLEGVQYEQCDVLDREGLAKLFDRHAPFDILVSTATGGTRAMGPFLQMDLDGFQASFDKLWGYANVVRLGAPHLATTGCIVLVSGAPARRAKPGQIALASVGASVEQFARVLAAELAPRRINVVCPGIIETPMFGPEGEERASRLAGATSGHLVPRPGTADEVARAILFTIHRERLRDGDHGGRGRGVARRTLRRPDGRPQLPWMLLVGRAARCAPFSCHPRPLWTPAWNRTEQNRTE
ncbi:unnamed protein product, partial [Prorocentrum cordatum]